MPIRRSCLQTLVCLYLSIGLRLLLVYAYAWTSKTSNHTDSRFLTLMGKSPNQRLLIDVPKKYLWHWVMCMKECRLRRLSVRDQQKKEIVFGVCSPICNSDDHSEERTHWGPSVAPLWRHQVPTRAWNSDQSRSGPRCGRSGSVRATPGSSPTVPIRNPVHAVEPEGASNNPDRRNEQVKKRKTFYEYSV